MQLFEAILEANHRAVAGDDHAGLHPAEFADELPVAALTCIDPRLNPLFPGALGLPPESFIWLRNAGNIITGTLSSTMRSLALACAVKGGREIAIIGHTDCLVGKTTTSKLTDAFRAMGVERQGLPENLTDFFGMFASERQNVLRAVDIVRLSPLIGHRIPVHGLMIDVGIGKLEWIANGYQALELTAPRKATIGVPGDDSIDIMKSFAAFEMGEMKFPDSKIGDTVAPPAHLPQAQPPAPAPTPPPPAPQVPRARGAHPIPPKLPVPPRLRHR
jgi:carbonic anhydrase